VIQALRETGYTGWIAMEPFIYEPDGPTCAARMIGYVAGLLEQSA
jgi:D-psicose/D-tagatose/L-ribulose 3-epimerase